MLQPEDTVHITDEDHHVFWVSLLYFLKTYWVNTLEDKLLFCKQFNLGASEMVRCVKAFAVQGW